MTSSVMNDACYMNQENLAKLLIKNILRQKKFRSTSTD